MEVARKFSPEASYEDKAWAYAGVVSTLVPGGKVAVKAVKLGRLAKKAKYFIKGTGKVPNPHGKKGGPLHVAKIEALTKELKAKGYNVKLEHYVETPGGHKNSRYGDILVTNKKTGEKWMIQVGKQTKKGNPISRESKAIKDLQNAGYRVEFEAYN